MSLHYHITGSGPTIILLHGFLSDSRYWRGITSSLSQHYRVVTIDLLGFGKSPKPKTATYSLTYQAQLVAKTIKDVSDEPVSITRTLDGCAHRVSGRSRQPSTGAQADSQQYAALRKRRASTRYTSPDWGILPIRTLLPGESCFVAYREGTCISTSTPP